MTRISRKFKHTPPPPAVVPRPIPYNKSIAVLFITTIPGSFVYGCLSHVLTSGSNEIALSKWGIVPWAVVLTSTLLYGAATHMLSQELKKKWTDRDLTNARVTLGKLSAGSLLSAVALSYLPYLTLPQGSSKADQKNAYFNGNILMMATLIVAGLSISRLNKARLNSL